MIVAGTANSVALPRVEIPRAVYAAVVALSLFIIIVLGAQVGGFLGTWLFRAAVLITVIVIWHDLWVAVYLLLWSAFFMDWLSDDEALNLVPRSFNALIEVILVLLALRLAGLKLRNPSIVWPDFSKVVLLLAAFGLAIAVAYGVGPYAVILGARRDFKWIMFFFLVLNLPLSNKFFRNTLVFVLFLIIIQLPIALAEYLLFAKTDDQVYGSLRSTGVASVLVTAAICLLIGFFMYHKKHPLHVAGAFALMLLPVLGEAKAFFLLFPVSITLLFRRVIFSNPAQAFVAGGFLAVGFLAALILFSQVEGNVAITQASSAMLSLEPENIGGGGIDTREFSFATSFSARIANLASAHLAVSSSWPTLLFGFGLGSRTATEDTTSSREYYLHAPMANLIYELGYLGLLFYGMIFVYVFRASNWVFRNSKDRFSRALAFGYSVFPFVYVLCMFYTDVWYSPLAVTFWLGAAIVYKVKEELRGGIGAEKNPSLHS